MANAVSAPNVRVLVVDDDDDNRELYAEYLDSLGHVVDAAGNGAEAVSLARARRPDVVTTDLSLPVFDGWELLRQLRADGALRSIRVIAVTGHTDPTTAERARDAGFDGFLVKPCLPQTLAATITELLAAKHQ